MTSWQLFAIASAFFAGLTAIFGKVGVAEINSNLATLIRTLVIFAMTSLIVSWRSEWEPLNKLSGRSVLFLCLSGVATGLSWLCYYRALQLGPASRVARRSTSSSVVFVIVLAFVFLQEPLGWRRGVRRRADRGRSGHFGKQFSADPKSRAVSVSWPRILRRNPPGAVGPGSVLSSLQRRLRRRSSSTGRRPRRFRRRHW